MRDLAHGLRRLRRAGATSALAVSALALGIGLGSALFAAVDAVLLRPLPFAEEGRLVFVTETDDQRGATQRPVSYPDYLDLARDAKTLAAVAAMPNTLSEALTLATASGPVRLEGAAVSHGFFDVLGVRPALGKAFEPGHDRAGAERTLVLADAAWRHHFGADPRLVGRSVELSGESYRVIGIAPADFEYPKGAELWTPLVPAQPAYLEARTTGWLHLVARLAPGATVEAADAELDGLVARQAALATGGGTEKRSAVVTPLRDHLVGDAGPALGLLAAAVALVLLIACSNVASLLVAHGLARRRELVVRTALGASRARLVRLLLCETLVVAALGTGLGLGLAHLSLTALIGLAPVDVPGLASATIDGRVSAFAVALAFASALLAGLWPALSATREAPVDGLRGQSRGSSSEARAVRARRVLVGLEAAFAVVVLALAGLVVRSFLRLSAQELGYRPDQALTARVGPDEWRHPKPEDRRRFHHQLLAQLRAAPGVTAAGSTLLRPLELGPIGIDGWYLLPGQPEAAAQQNPIVNYMPVTPGYLPAMGLSPRAGRDFGERDGADGALVAIVGERLARMLWPGQDAIGQRLATVGSKAPDGSFRFSEVIGVVADGRYRGLADVRLDLYVPVEQSPFPVQFVVVRGRDEATHEALATRLRAAVAALDPLQPVTDVAPLRALVADAQGGARFRSQATGGFAVLALLLAALGIFGVVGWSVAERRRELAVRLALGAGRADVLGLVLRDGLAPVAAGVLAGLAAAAVLARLVRSLLFEVSAADPAIFALAAGLLLAAAVAACLPPALRASRVDPAEALAAE
ncbi:MAG: ADOP family duplicated permease [Vicinamibacteria bacterium]|nr:ADOP family duplicated permease [Vicinamibacteria bacterium]